MLSKENPEMRKKRNTKKLKPAPKTKYKNQFFDDDEEFSDEDIQSSLNLTIDDLYDDDDDDRF